MGSWAAVSSSIAGAVRDFKTRKRVTTCWPRRAPPGRCPTSCKAPPRFAGKCTAVRPFSTMRHRAGRCRGAAPVEEVRSLKLPESLFVYSCFYPAGEGPFRAGYESVPGNSPELAQPISGEITALSDHSSSVGRPVHARQNS
jgi:hypothetical protein